MVHVRDNVPGAVYVGRPRGGRDRCGAWGNPYRIGPDRTRAQAIAEYRAMLFRVRPRLRALPMRRGKPLACWCRHDGEARTEDNACHADVLIELLDRFTDAELRVMRTGGRTMASAPTGR